MSWKTQNKRRPGAYINVVGKGKDNTGAEIGRTLLPISTELNWGAKGIIKLTHESNFKALLGHDLNESELQTLHEVLKGADTVLLLNNNDGQPASKVDPALPWTITAIYPGTKGNKLHISVQKQDSKVTVSTLFGTKLVDQQVIDVDKPEKLMDNDYVKFKVNGELAPQPSPQDDSSGNNTPTVMLSKLEQLQNPITVDLTGGTTVPVQMTELLNDALETEDYDVATTAGFPVDSPLHKQLVEEIKHLREDNDIKVRGVVPVTTDIVNYEGVSTVANGVVLGDGTELDATVAAGYFAGTSSSATAAKSLTYVEYPDAISAYPKLSNDKTIDALEKGQIVFTTKRNEAVVIEQDINSLTKITAEKPVFFSKNRVVRTMDTIVTRIKRTFEEMFIGKITNNLTGRDLFKANIVSYLQSLSDNGIINGFDTNDIAVEAGDERDSILVNLAITPLDSMEKLYMTMVVQ
ncbi:phage tail protein [Lactobacillus sp. ESL0236]|uniref:phage tail sheath family protein n=1 Tax=unclassified Lactobacillus TaxID=2620435 RepID=UPI000EFC58E4|nr:MULTISPECIES: phage tail sheath family protein [unclassified Lactobacillus]RMC39561.1 phage tail protein [Lactobacillus sp. ESL0237]RMC43625.1 phage tail protein [Lactobacillus sp. ESL0234]RMC45107.1 phage tail protein [Lactobacillus sp. ESL0236]